MAEVSVNNLLESIEQSKKTTFSRFINGLGIRNIGQNTAKILEKYSYGSMQYLMNANEEDLVNINEVGLIMAKSLTDFFNKNINIENINRCLDAGVSFKKIKTLKPSSITGKIFVFTGSLDNYSRKDAQELIESYGARLLHISLALDHSFRFSIQPLHTHMPNYQLEIFTDLHIINRKMYCVKENKKQHINERRKRYLVAQRD